MSENTNGQQNKWVCAIAYLGFLFFLPLVIDGDNEFHKFHANQALNLFLLGVIVNLAGTLIPVIGWFLILPIGGIACLVFFIMGVLNAINETMKELPLIGKFRLIK